MTLAALLLAIALILAVLATIGINGGRVGLHAAAFAFFLGYLLVADGVL